MNFFEAVGTCFRKSFVFSGRAPRSEYWWFVLFGVTFSLIIEVPFAILGDPIGISAFFSGREYDNDIIYALSLLYGIAVILAALFITVVNVSVGVRRLHDIGRSGWFILLPPLSFLVSLLGIPTGSLAVLGIGFILVLLTGIVLIVWLATAGNKADNKYGAPPLP